MRLLTQLEQAHQTGQKSLAVLIDPDKTEPGELRKLLRLANECRVDYLFVGGSLLGDASLSPVVSLIKEECNIPLVLFPSNASHLDRRADAVLFLSLISGRNPELLIGQHVAAAPLIVAAGLEALPTGYLLIDGGRPTTASYISGTQPLPADKPQIAACTALAGEMLGLRIMYLDGGSGAQSPVPAALIKAVRKSVKTPLIIGGGIRTLSQARTAFEAGADVLVVGNRLEEDANALIGLAELTAELNASKAAQ